MTTSAVRSLPTVAPRVVVALLAALALAVAVVLLTGLGITASDSAGASWNKTTTKAGASWNTVVATKSGASWN
jgi:Na+(H+)/acetate symporter ActP